MKCTSPLLLPVNCFINDVNCTMHINVHHIVGICGDPTQPGVTLLYVIGQEMPFILIGTTPEVLIERLNNMFSTNQTFY